MSKFLTYKNRLDIQKYLKECLSFYKIARRLDKDPTTISREVRNYNAEVATGYPGFAFNACVHRKTCRKKDICGTLCSRKSTQYCKLCSKCNNTCNDYLEELCIARLKPPYVCNGCESIGKCTLIKNIYDAEHAHIRSHEKISNSRSGLCVSEEEISRLNMLAFLRDANTSKSVIDINDTLYEILGKEEFIKLFPVILTDNGSEFSNPKAIEYGGEKFTGLRTRVFYCDAGSPYQKGSIKVNHELIRRLFPKYKSSDTRKH